MSLTSISLSARADIILKWFQMTRSTILTWSWITSILLRDLAQRSCEANRASAFESRNWSWVINLTHASILTSWSRAWVAWIRMFTIFTDITSCTTAKTEEKGKKPLEVTSQWMILLNLYVVVIMVESIWEKKKS